MAPSGRLIVLMTLASCIPGFLYAAESHSETYTYYATVSSSHCVQQSSKKCRGALFWRNCDTFYYSDCSVDYDQVLRLGRRCQKGWTSFACDVPICNPQCNDGKVCTAPDKCECIRTGGGCQSVPCDSAINCYPGTCLANPTCSCPSGFSGPNCINIIKTPDISACQIQLYNGSTTLFKEASCEPPGIDPQTTVWIGAKTITQIQVKWTTSYVQPLSLPNAPYVANAPIGVANTGFTIAGTYTPCSVANEQTPQSTVNCDVPRAFNDYGVTPVHNQSLRVDVSSRLGGHKDGANSKITGSTFQAQYFTGTTTNRSALFRFDLSPPVHCLSHSNSDCPVFAIYLDADITTNPTIEPKFYDWSDDGSGIFKYHVEIFFMQPNAENHLANSGGSVIKSDVDASKNNFVYTCTTSGVYSIELTVQDQAGNTARARKLFIFNKDSKLMTYPDKPVYIREADANTGYSWITKYDDPRNGGNIPLTLVWAGHFSSSAQFDSSWGLPAEPWPSTEGIDDSYKDLYGRRSIFAITNMPNGIIGYSVAYIVDQSGGGKGLVPVNWNWLNATNSSYSLPISSLLDGYSIVVWLRCFDVAGGQETVNLVLNVDRTAPEVQKASFMANGVDESTSRMSIEVSDKASGIRNISFAIYDSILKNLVYSGFAGPQKREAPNPSGGQKKRKRRLVQPCTTNDTTCYCIPSGDCYNYIQTVDIDNCWLDRLAGHTFEFRFTVTNGANLASAEQTQPLGELNLQCRKYQLPVAGIVIGCILGFLLLIAIIIVIVLLVRVYVLKKPIPRPLANARKAISDRFSVGPRLDENIVYTSADDIGASKNNQLASKANKTNKLKSKADDVYVYNSGKQGTYEEISESTAGGPKVFKQNQIHLGEMISEGRLAIITKAQLARGNETEIVAVKGLKRGYSEEDTRLMTDKIAFQHRIPDHVNIVKFLGVMDKAQDNGPMMILEYCELSLKDWLERIDQMNSDVLEDMLTFTLNIANGVKHLHDNNVVHRRLGARNVLLKRQYGGLVAKLIGFGPNKEDHNGEQASLPIKWLAPETLEAMSKGLSKYDKKSDAWSFGITIWEIYSKGESPYSNLQSDQVKKQLTKEKRMVLTRPEACPAELFESVVTPCWNFKPNRRPDFREICTSIDKFRKGAGMEPVGYYVSKSTENENSYGIPLYEDAA